MATPPKSPEPEKPQSPEVEALLNPHRPDGMERAILQGKTVDSDFKPVEIKPDYMKAPVILTEDRQTEVKGDLKTGDVGWVELDDKGAPTGGASPYPLKDKPMAPVASVVEVKPTVLATPAGAFLSESGNQPSPAAYKYSSSAYGRDYAAIADAVQKRHENEFYKGPNQAGLANTQTKTPAPAPAKAP